MEFNVTLEQFERVFAENEGARLRRLESAVYEAAAAGVGPLVSEAPIDTGHLRQSAHLEQDVAAKVVEIVFDAPYSALVELGTRPHIVSLRALFDWVQRHAASFGANSNSDVFRIAHAIQNKIAEFGTEPTFFVRDRIPELEQILVGIVSARLAIGG
jgi:hypothetical protein